MPCDSSYMEATNWEKECQRAGKLLVYVNTRLGLPVENWLRAIAEDYYGRHSDRAVLELCAVLHGLPNDVRTKLVYDARSRDARDLANWWEDHQKADQEREAKENAERKRIIGF